MLVASSSHGVPSAIPVLDLPLNQLVAQLITLALVRGGSDVPKLTSGEIPGGGPIDSVGVCLNSVQCQKRRVEPLCFLHSADGSTCLIHSYGAAEAMNTSIFAVAAAIVSVFCFGVKNCHAAATLTTKDIVDKAVPSTETVLGPNDFASAPEMEIDLRKLGIQVPEDPTLGNHTEGDIAIQKMQVNAVGGVARDAIRQTYRKWPGGEIPYALSSQYGSYARSVIAKAMAEYHSKTCIRFVPRDEQRHRDYVFIHPDDGCYSLVGRTGGRQPLSLDAGCIQTGTIVHELMHSVGFFHEQSRTDRDQYIEIRWENVMKGADDQFERYGPSVIQDLGEPYDYSSIMHYGPYAFSDNGKRTIVALKAGADRMGQRVAFSELDLKKINKLYECSSGNPSGGLQGNGILDGAPAAPPQVCEDNNWRCRFWAISMLGYCDNYEEIRSVVCPKSCGTCSPRGTTSFGFNTDASPPCQDKHPSCPIWKQFRDSCDLPSTGMRSICPASCGLCPTQNPLPQSGICGDTGGFFTCKSALLLARCDRHRQDCARTCGFC
ncbi:hypothetical protein QR680_007992 [Steinernema hermaphroditum]|uniref:Metalloendopeptidase n=1 Tax=Steinernema hermaphroditum TaxID=289476 RepID=A0AA39M714_9BILA|nr:hypothetical protein QR680_007992 [Steinernema hermaphroditum]